MTLGAKIKWYRKQLKITQKQLAEKCNIAEITIRQYEADKYIPKIGNLQKIAVAFNIPLSDLFEVDGEQNWEKIAADFPESSVLQIGNEIHVPVFSDELSSYQKNINNLIVYLNLDGLIATNNYISNLLKQKKYSIKPPTTE
ncbi:MAG: helix-turn-helix transcriptional regulator [Lachnospiraceae bacterium]|jgi:transcriptional regulator with XRE-family HTH domain|nr:helix-turn-helix transcriptional regulator [Lachnospiraceae bacterium]